MVQENGSVAGVKTAKPFFEGIDYVDGSYFELQRSLKILPGSEGYDPKVCCSDSKDTDELNQSLTRIGEIVNSTDVIRMNEFELPNSSRTKVLAKTQEAGSKENRYKSNLENASFDSN